MGVTIYLNTIPPYETEILTEAFGLLLLPAVPTIHPFFFNDTLWNVRLPVSIFP